MFEQTFAGISIQNLLERVEALETLLADHVPCACTACSNARTERRRVAFVERRLALAKLRGADFDAAVGEISPGDLVQLAPHIALAETLADASPATRKRLDQYLPWHERIRLSVADDHKAGRLAPLVEVRAAPSVVNVPGRTIKVDPGTASRLREAGCDVAQVTDRLATVVGYRFTRPGPLSRDMPLTLAKSAWEASLSVDDSLREMVADGRLIVRALSDAERTKHELSKRHDKHQHNVLLQQMRDR